MNHGNLCSSREVPNGVGADGVGVKFPLFPVNCSRLPLFQEKNEKKRRKTKKNEKKRRKTKKNEKAKKNEKKRKKWENSSDPIYTNPIKNLPIFCGCEVRRNWLQWAQKMPRKGRFSRVSFPPIFSEKDRTVLKIL